jgi:hypothetical protein
MEALLSHLQKNIDSRFLAGSGRVNTKQPDIYIYILQNMEQFVK